MSDTLISDFDLGFYSDVFTGKTEHMDFTDVDRAVAGFFQAVVHTFTVTDTERTENKEFARFADRAANTKVFTGRFDDPQTFVRKLVAKYCSGDNKRERNEILPACYVTREPTISFAELSENTDVTAAGTLSDVDGIPYAQLNQSVALLTYRVTAVAWSEPTLTRLMLGLMMWLRHTKKNDSHSFTAKTSIAGAPVEVSIRVSGVWDAMSEVNDIALDESRIVSMSLTYEVKVDIFEAEELARTSGLVGLMEGDQIV